MASVLGTTCRQRSAYSKRVLRRSGRGYAAYRLGWLLRSSSRPMSRSIGTSSGPAELAVRQQQPVSPGRRTEKTYRLCQVHNKQVPTEGHALTQSWTGGRPASSLAGPDDTVSLKASRGPREAGRRSAVWPTLYMYKYLFPAGPSPAAAAGTMEGNRIRYFTSLYGVL